MKEGLIPKIIHFGFVLILITIVSVDTNQSSWAVAATNNCASLVGASDNSLSLSQLQQKETCQSQLLSQYNTQISQSQQQASSLQQTIDGLTGSINSTNSQISLTQNQIGTTQTTLATLNNQIQDTQHQLADLGTQLNQAYDNLYELSQTNALDMVVSGNDINDLLNQSQYIESLQTQLQSNIDQANKLKDNLGSQKQSAQQQIGQLQSLNSQLVSSKSSLNNQVAAKNNLLSQTQGQEANYQTLVAKLKSQIETVSSDEAAARAREAANDAETITGGTGGYPWASANPNGIDPWLFYYRQCTSFGAWKFQAYFGVAFNNTRPGQGSAWNWPALATDQGYHTSSAPRADSIVSWPINTAMNMDYGHIAWVTAVNSDGTINVQEYNWTTPLGYDQRTNVNPNRYGNATYIYP